MDLTKRIASMDLLRGFAVLGILIMNIVAFAAPEPAYMSPAWAGTASFADELTYSAQFLVANGRFYSLFCLLFGAGLVMFYQRAQFKGFDADKLLKSRLRWLLLFGVLHLTLFFYGDILVTYALCGMLLFSSIKNDGRVLIRRGIIYIFVAIVIFTGLALLTLIESPDNESFLGYPIAPSKIQALSAQATGSVGQMIWYNVKHGGPLVLSLPLMFWLLGGIMTLGMGLMKQDFFNKGLSNRLELLFISIGIILSSGQLLLLWQTAFVDELMLFIPANMLAAIFIAVAVASRGIKICQNNPNFAMPLQYAGRMAFSLYIFQSLAMTIMFRWVAPQLFSTISRLEMMAVVLIMTILQLILATWWQTKIGQGPLEKLWRWLIYRNVTFAREK